MEPGCPYENEHPAIAEAIDGLKARVDSLERAEASRNKIRADDMKEFRAELKDTNTKVTALMLQLAGLNGKLAAAVFFSSALGAVAMLVMAKVMGVGP